MKFYLILAWGFAIASVARMFNLIDMSDRVSDTLVYLLVAVLYVQEYEKGKARKAQKKERFE